jgi:hypothetical protein
MHSDVLAHGELRGAAIRAADRLRSCSELPLDPFARSEVVDFDIDDNRGQHSSGSGGVPCTGVRCQIAADVARFRGDLAERCDAVAGVGKCVEGALGEYRPAVARPQVVRWRVEAALSGERA